MPSRRMQRVPSCFDLLTIVQIQCGSETTLEFDFEAKHFATLLGFEGYETKHNFWKEAFPLLYGGSVEEVAARSSYSI